MSGSSVIIESLFLVVSIVAFSAFAAAYSSNSSLLNDFQRASLRDLKERYQTDVKIVLSIYDADAGVVKIFVKNTGMREFSLGEVSLIEVYLISSRMIEVYSYSEMVSRGKWSIEYMNDADLDGKWSRGETIVIIAVPSSHLGIGDYVVRLVLFNGLSFDGYFSV